MNVSEYIVKSLQDKGIKDLFGYPGSLICFFMDAVRSSGITNHLCHHEQACGFAATGYARITNKLAVCYATSGPGASNLITAVAHAYYESIPVLFITGQVHTDDMKRELPIRQLGNQEYDIIAAVSKITKYAALTDKVSEVSYHVSKALYEAENNRPGPVLLDIPVNIQRSEMEGLNTPHFLPPTFANPDYRHIAEVILSEIKQAKKPLILAGQGISISGTRQEFRAFAEKVAVPVVTSMSAVDLTPNGGFIGANGQAAANAMLDTCDLLVTFGTRIPVRHMRGNHFFTNDKKLIRVDIDEAELARVVKPGEIKFIADLRGLWKELLK